MGKIDYGELGLKVGIEVHMQLDTEKKLFCDCPTLLRSEKPDFVFVRRLRPTQSELGQVDPAALFEFKKGMTVVYEGYDNTTCLVETDEEPPHSINSEAIDIGLSVALMIGAQPVDEVHAMRKVVIDGSNTTGFQRTSVLALDGSIKVDGKVVPIQAISLEEDAARKIGGERFSVIYRLDRLGIPLLEVTTGPVIHSPDEAGKIALAIGQLVMATGKVKSELGSIRQDINLSLKDGALTEIKGVQRLGLLPKVIEYEVRRQLKLLEIRDELKRRGLSERFRAEVKDVTKVFAHTRSKIVEKAIKRGGRVLAVRLPRFGGLLGTELVPNYRFGTELADVAVFWGGVGGIFHTDELPTAGISDGEVSKLKRQMGAKDGDAVVIVADDVERARDAINAIVERVREAVKGVPSDTRMADPTGITHYMRPRPGAARMYPETDIPTVKITRERIGRIKAILPEKPEEKVRRLVSTYKISEKLARELLYSPYARLFEEVASKVKIPASVIAVSLTETIRTLSREGVPVENLTRDRVAELLRLVDDGVTAKESIPEVLKWLAEHEGAPAIRAIEDLGLKAITLDELNAIVDKVVQDSKRLIKERGLAAVGPIVGVVMRQVRGRIDGRLVHEAVEKRVSKLAS